MLSVEAFISATGRCVVFQSEATNLVAGDTNYQSDIFLHDRSADTTTRVSVDTSGGDSDDDSYHPSVSSNCRYVAFSSDATDLVSSDSNGIRDIFVRDMRLGVTRRSSVGYDSAAARGGGDYPSISADGSSIAFTSSSSELVASDTNGAQDVFVRNRTAGTTELISTGSNGSLNYTYNAHAISSDGDRVVYFSNATNLTSVASAGCGQVYVYDRNTATTDLVSYDVDGSDSGSEAICDSSYGGQIPAISPNGNLVAFQSVDSDLVAGDLNGNASDIYLRNLSTGETIGLTTSGTDSINFGSSGAAGVTNDGTTVYSSHDEDLVADDTNGGTDVFVATIDCNTIAGC